ncbi:MAG: hypothetical protein KKE29_19920 [Proteobacteria bacterium]|nr:hypothetical protein [Pseudomonadota bacterium]MBU4574423.1 hypothetical protein [Pseudomonadota bacterium]MBV1715958.1 hypothetical protein [Desulfarculus sp.]
MATGVKIKVKYKGKSETGPVVTVEYTPVTGPNAGKTMEYTKAYRPGADAREILATARQGIESILTAEAAPEPDLTPYLDKEMDLAELPAVEVQAL